MGLLNLFNRAEPTLLPLPAGSFTVDRQGCLLVGTIPTSYPAEIVQEIADKVISLFKTARSSQVPLNEITIHYPGFQITARELRGGAMVFLMPKAPSAGVHQA